MTLRNIRTRAQYAADVQGDDRLIQDSINEMFAHVRAVCTIMPYLCRTTNVFRHLGYLGIPVHKHSTDA